jgi:hypothetical protein
MTLIFGWVWDYRPPTFPEPPEPRVGDRWLRAGRMYRWDGQQWKPRCPSRSPGRHQESTHSPSPLPVEGQDLLGPQNREGDL